MKAVRAAVRALGVALLALSAFTGSASAAPASSASRPLRPYDAPRIEAEHITVPPLPLEYHSDEDAGIRLSYHPSTGERARALGGRVSAIRSELSAELGRDVLAQVEIRVAAAPSEMARLAPVEQIPSYATAVAFSEVRLVVMSAASPLSLEPPDLEVWLRHELAHLALDEALGARPVPHWFHEGYAVHFSGEDTTVRFHALTVASLERKMLDLHALEAEFPVEAPQGSMAYAEAADFVRFLAQRSHRERFKDLLARIRSAEPCLDAPRCRMAFEGAVAAAYGDGFDRIELYFRREAAKRYGFVPVFVAATLLWMTVAALIALRRYRKRRNLPLFRRARSAGAVRRAGLAGAAASANLRLGAALPFGGDKGIGRRGAGAGALHVGGRRVLDDMALEEPIPPDPEVPKVEHDGRWYTLH